MKPSPTPLQDLPQTHRASPPSYSGQQPIVFFDGDCVMCNGFANLLFRIDPTGRVLIATLQGQTAQRYLPALPTDREQWSFYYLNHQGCYDQSEAFIQLCNHLGGVWRIFNVIRLVPAPIRNMLYRFIARNRYRWFGRRSTCRRPTLDEQMRFLN